MPADPLCRPARGRPRRGFAYPGDCGPAGNRASAGDARTMADVVLGETTSGRPPAAKVDLGPLHDPRSCTLKRSRHWLTTGPRSRPGSTRLTSMSYRNSALHRTVGILVKLSLHYVDRARAVERVDALVFRFSNQVVISSRISWVA